MVVGCGGATTTDDGGVDAVADVHAKDALVVDDGVADVVDASSNGCVPDLPDAYVSAWVPPSAHQSVCTSTQLTDLYDDCVSPTHTSAMCNAFQSIPANVTCFACVETPLGSSTYGPMIEWHSGSSLEANVGGCMALVDGDATSTGCGAKYEAWDGCRLAACSYCPGGTWDSCANPAGSDPSICGKYESAAQTCLNDPKYAPCSQTTFESYLVTYGTMFCSAD